MMQSNIRRALQKGISRRYKHHREIDDTIRATGLTNTHVVRNPSVAEIYEYAMLPQLRESHDRRVRDTVISSTGALVNYSGHLMGRSPKDKRVVYDELTQDQIFWWKF